MLGLHFCARALSSCGERGPLFIAVRGPLTIAASLVAEHSLQMLRLSSCDARAQLLRGMWDLPRPGLEPVSPALAGRFSTTVPPGKPENPFLCFFQLRGAACIPWLVAPSCIFKASHHLPPTSSFILTSPSLALLPPSFPYKDLCDDVGPIRVIL